jgi:transcriptional regulator with XRE-family HTH domain
MTVGNRVKEIIANQGYKQKSIATKTGIDEKRFNAILNGRVTFSVDDLILNGKKKSLENVGNPALSRLFGFGAGEGNRRYRLWLRPRFPLRCV